MANDSNVVLISGRVCMVTNTKIGFHACSAIVAARLRSNMFGTGQRVIGSGADEGDEPHIEQRSLTASTQGGDLMLRLHQQIAPAQIAVVEAAQHFERTIALHTP